VKKFQILIETDEVPDNMFTEEATVVGNILASSLGNGLIEDLEKAEHTNKLLRQIHDLELELASIK